MQPTPGKAVFVRALVILNFDINCHFYTRHISVQNIGYQSTWSVIIGIGIGPEKCISVDPYLEAEHLYDNIKKDFSDAYSRSCYFLKSNKCSN